MIQNKVPDMHITWLNALKSEFDKPYMENLRDFLIKEKHNNKDIYPPSEKVFSSLKFTSLDNVKVVIIGQDPYHGYGQANGLAFSVEKGIKIPPSLLNIYREINSDIGKEPPIHGDLTHWAKQGVVLLNSVLTVEKGNPASHAGKGWEDFTDKIIKLINHRDEIVFMLWGAYAQKKGLIIDTKRHKVLNAPHPSPLSVHRGFFGSRHFSQANEYLKSKGKSEILWI